MRAHGSLNALVLSCALIASAAAGPAAADAGGKGGRKVDQEPPRPGAAGGVAAPNAIRAATADDLVYGEAIQYHNLSLVPVGTRRQGPFQKYTLLEQGLAAKTLEVRELNGQSGQAQVNALEVRNKGRLPVYLLGGEAVLGGKQDRIIQQDAVVAPDQRWTRVAVFCVEQGRWHGQNMKFSSGEALAHVALRKAALSGNQGDVWAEVARKNLKHGTQSSSGTYRRTIQNEGIRSKIAPYRKAIVGMLPPDLQLAGMVFAINGKIRVADLFGNPVLFGDLRDKLVSAYLLEALGEQEDRRAAPITKGAAKSWLTNAKSGKRMKLQGTGRSESFKMDSPNAVGAETVDKENGQKVRETYMSK
jgi:hypothetical protein